MCACICSYIRIHCVAMCVRIYVYRCVCMRVYIHIYTCMHTRIQPLQHGMSASQMQKYIHTYIHTYIRGDYCSAIKMVKHSKYLYNNTTKSPYYAIKGHTHTHAHTHTYIHTYIYTYIHAFIHTFRLPQEWLEEQANCSSRSNCSPLAKEKQVPTS